MPNSNREGINAGYAGEFDPNFKHGQQVHGDVRSALPRYEDAFGEHIADNTNNRLDASGTYDYNIGRHRFIEDLNTDGGTFIFDPANTTAFDDLAGKMQVTAAAGEEHIFGAREIIRYVPTYELLFGTAAWAESSLLDGQHFAVEFAQKNAENGYRFHFFGSPDGPQLNVEQISNNTVVNSFDPDLETIESESDFDHTKPSVARGKINWYGAGIAKYELSHPEMDIDDPDVAIGQTNQTVGFTANRDDVATQESNNTIQVRVWAESGADTFTVNICSLGALIRGNATEVNREKPSVHWDIGGSISQYPTDNVDQAIAARIDPNRRNVAVKLTPPIFQPGGSGVTMELGVYAVQEDNPDLTVNFDDPDDDGVDEGPSPASQARESTDVMQYTRDVTSIPTDTDIRADATTGLVPNMRHLTSTIGQSGGGTQPGSSSAGELTTIKRNVYPDDVVIFLPRTRPTGSTTNGVIRWLKPVFEQDF